jgi:hypothetical protein
MSIKLLSKSNPIRLSVRHPKYLASTTPISIDINKNVIRLSKSNQSVYRPVIRCTWLASTTTKSIDANKNVIRVQSNPFIRVILSTLRQPQQSQ